MNLRHAAALAFAGWWLIVPPMTQDNRQVRRDVPFVSWPAFGKYESQKLCEAKKAWLKIYLDDHLVADASNREGLLRELRAGLRCINVAEVAPETKAAKPEGSRLEEHLR